MFEKFSMTTKDALLLPKKDARKIPEMESNDTFALATTNFLNHGAYTDSIVEAGYRMLFQFCSNVHNHHSESEAKRLTIFTTVVKMVRRSDIKRSVVDMTFQHTSIV